MPGERRGEGEQKERRRRGEGEQKESRGRAEGEEERGEQHVYSVVGFLVARVLSRMNQHHVY